MYRHVIELPQTVFFISPILGWSRSTGPGWEINTQADAISTTNCASSCPFCVLMMIIIIPCQPIYPWPVQCGWLVVRRVHTIIIKVIVVLIIVWFLEHVHGDLLAFIKWVVPVHARECTVVIIISQIIVYSIVWKQGMYISDYIKTK